MRMWGIAGWTCNNLEARAKEWDRMSDLEAVEDEKMIGMSIEIASPSAILADGLAMWGWVS